MSLELKVAISGGEPADHVCRIEVTDPTGNARPEYGERVLCAIGQGQYVLPLAHNDPVGQWKVRATEIVSGKTAEISVEVKPAR